MPETEGPLCEKIEACRPSSEACNSQSTEVILLNQTGTSIIDTPF